MLKYTNELPGCGQPTSLPRCRPDMRCMKLKLRTGTSLIPGKLEEENSRCGFGEFPGNQCF